ncbi:DUF6783 domain-containing protein [Anaerobutyricum hallii]
MVRGGFFCLIQAKSPTKCNAHLAESIFQTRSSVEVGSLSM